MTSLRSIGHQRSITKSAVERVLNPIVGEIFLSLLGKAQECEAPCIQDDYGEACLAETLGVKLMAQEVIPATQPRGGEDETLTQGFGEVEPVALFQDSQVADTEVDESTPKQSEVIEVADSQPTVTTFTSGAMTTVLTDPMPSKKKYTQEDLKALRAKIEKVKYLNWAKRRLQIKGVISWIFK